MLQKYILLVLISLTTSLGFTQPPGGGPSEKKREQIHAQKIAFISTQLNLTTEEAQKFWPIYNQYEAEIEKIRKERRGYMNELKKSAELSDDRAYELTEKIFATESKESQTRLNYLKQFAGVLGKKKAAEVFIAEEKFKRELLEKLKKEGRPAPPDRGEP
jgi:Spy/CpxP family protein refolding chaperone